MPQFSQAEPSWTPWVGRWQVCFIPAPLHWITSALRRNRAPFQHCFLLQPVGDGDHWLMAEWTFRSYGVTIVDRPTAARLHRIVQSRGAMLEFWGSEQVPQPSLFWAFRPKTCVTFVRSVLGLRPKTFVWTCEQLWYELLDLGAVALIDPPHRRPACPLAVAENPKHSPICSGR
jgi:hypothetical protein